MKVFLTGATGYVGHQLALALANKNFIIHALCRDNKCDKIPKHNNIMLFEGDVCDFDSVIKAMSQCDYVYHTAAYTNLKCKNINNFYNTNVLGTENILKAALQSHVQKVIYTSTLSVFGPSYKDVPIIENQPRLESYANDYELTKSMAEELVLNYAKKGLPSVILNLSRVYGPGLNNYSNGVNELVNMISKKDFLIVPSKLDVIANYVYIDDVVSAHLLAMENGKSGEKYIIGGENMNYSKLFETIRNLSNSNIRILKVNYSLIKNALLVFSKVKSVVGLGSSLTGQVLDSLFVNRMASSNKAISRLNYSITPFGIGLNRTIEFLSR